MNWKLLDFNLLLIFQAMMKERNTTRVGEILGLTQSAVSHGLARLRVILKDELFIRSPRGMIATPLAESIYPSITHALEDLKAAFERKPFDPDTSNKSFNLAFNQYANLHLAGPFSKIFAQQAPHASLEIKPSFALPLLRLFDNEELDLAIVGELPAGIAERFRSDVILRDEHVAICRKGFLPSTSRLSLEQFTQIDHMRITSIDNEKTFSDGPGEHLLRQMNVKLGIPYIAAGYAISHFDMISVVARRTAKSLAQTVPLDILELPEEIEAPKLVTHMVWPRRFDDVPSHIWLRSVIRGCCTSIA